MTLCHNDANHLDKRSALRFSASGAPRAGRLTGRSGGSAVA